jgi:hypothetical protein
MAEKQGLDHVEGNRSMHTRVLGDQPAGHIPVTQEEKALSRALNRKLDIYLLPFLSLLYLFNGLDRGNVGNAETEGEFKVPCSASSCVWRMLRTVDSQALRKISERGLMT